MTVLLTATILLSACSSLLVPHQQKARHFSAQAGWDYGTVDAPPFVLAGALSPVRSADAPLTIYLEGDGMAYLAPRKVSGDPTPDDPVALRLALAHGGGPVAYLARPCQYVLSHSCAPAWWTTHRYAAEVVAGLNLAVDDMKRRAGAAAVILVGYSGGGALAVLLASRRTDVAGIVTIAANLDLATWTQLQGLGRLSGSLDPADVAEAIAETPQVHFVGDRDGVVPGKVAESYVSRSGNRGRPSLIRIAGFGHVCCWADEWKNLSHHPALAGIPGWPKDGRSGSNRGG